MPQDIEEAALEELNSKPQMPKPGPIHTIGSPEQLGELFTALARAQAKFEVPGKGEEGQIGNQRFRYADMAELRRCSRPHLTAEGLAVVQFITTESVITWLCHGSARVESVIEVSAPELDTSNNIKSFGAATTYLRRYAYQALLGLDGDDDLDKLPENHPMRPKQQPRMPPQQQRQKPQQRKPEPKPKPTPEPEPDFEPEPEPDFEEPEEEKTTTPLTEETTKRISSAIQHALGGKRNMTVSQKLVRAATGKDLRSSLLESDGLATLALIQTLMAESGIEDEVATEEQTNAFIAKLEERSQQ